VAATDLPLNYKAGDIYAGKDPNIVSAGYTNNFNGATATTLYVIDSKFNSLAIQSPPNDGVLTTVGSLGLNVTALSGFDITADNRAFASFDVGPTGSQFFKIDLATGAATLVGDIGQYVVIRDIALMADTGAAPAALGTADLTPSAPDVQSTVSGLAQASPSLAILTNLSSAVGQSEKPDMPVSAKRVVTAPLTIDAVDQLFADILA
jgi:hypothetical protein